MQPCRRTYTVVDDISGEPIRVGSHTLFSPQDLCTLPILPRMAEAGVDWLKIEGRNRPPEYVDVVVSAYREAVDAVAAGTFAPDLVDHLMPRLRSVYNKGFHTGFLEGLPSGETFTDVENSLATHRKVYVGRIEKVFRKIGVLDVVVHCRTLSVGETLMVIGPTTGVQRGVISSMFDVDHQSVDTARKGDIVGVKLDTSFVMRPQDKVFRMEPVALWPEEA